MSVKCLLCGLEYGTINNSHLRSAHNTTTEEYLKMFPGAELTSEETRQLMSERVREGLAAMTPGAKTQMGEHISESLNSMSEEAKADRSRRISEANSGLVRTEEQCQHYSEATRKKWKDPHYRRRSEESMSIAARNRPPVGKETREKSRKDREILDLICEVFGGSVYYTNSTSVHNWTLCGDESRKLTVMLLEKSHCPQKVERLRKNFVGPSYYELNREKVRARRTRQCKERRLIQTYMREHPGLEREESSEKAH